MIKSLHIENIAVIKHADIDFSNGFTVLSGETGAGKSLIIDSINILLCNKNFKEKIRVGEKTATVSAFFDDLDNEVKAKINELGFSAEDGILLSRSGTDDNKTTLRLNGTVIPTTLGKEIGRLLITIHGQNDNQTLLMKSSHRSVLDAFSNLSSKVDEYNQNYRLYDDIIKRLESLKKDDSEKARLLDMYKYQAKEIDDAKLNIGEEEKLELEEKRLSNIEKIEKHSNFIFNALHSSDKSVSAILSKVAQSLASLSGICENADEYKEKIIQYQYEIDDIAYSVADYANNGSNESSDVLLDKIETRLDLISKLKRKYGQSIEDILQYREKIENEIVNNENQDELVNKLLLEKSKYMTVLKSLSSEISNIRKENAKVLEISVAKELAFLEMPKVKFHIDIKQSEDFTPYGIDDIEFMISTNEGMPLSPMIKIASGGELSRIMLALKSVLLDKDGATSVIFDEIDTGISGKTSRKVGIKLKEISKKIQVICITHSAQIASLSDNHLLITKSEINNNVETSVRLISYEEKIQEIARILGGINITKTQIATAKEMIDEGLSYEKD